VHASISVGRATLDTRLLSTDPGDAVYIQATDSLSPYWRGYRCLRHVTSGPFTESSSLARPPSPFMTIPPPPPPTLSQVVAARRRVALMAGLPPHRSSISTSGRDVTLVTWSQQRRKTVVSVVACGSNDRCRGQWLTACWHRHQTVKASSSRRRRRISMLVSDYMQLVNSLKMFASSASYWLSCNSLIAVFFLIRYIGLKRFYRIIPAILNSRILQIHTELYRVGKEWRTFVIFAHSRLLRTFLRAKAATAFSAS